ncbi:hypothetical protein FDP41_011221 [Naegleria fowleri]|uniref:Microsomal glutathione S-transferase 1 n=1 Tax=Naegleria fowleri TaxID=5763 RepID=A0A6A5C5B8_NAEFO|nr:uncharacterized protein FDP41_011221 [Naegleria fowleri]KAF0982291.1 hypothetical protein FDP41_011221 [Naegleria fowleri]CAG4712131.1 unnamed protein product [Naegleria fowleri]
MYKRKEGVYANPKDVRVAVVEKNKSSTETPLDDPSSMTNRMKRIHANDLENILPFFLVTVPYVLVSSLQVSSVTSPQYAIWDSVIGNVLMFSFTLSRYLYFVAYWRAWQPWRSLIWFWGVLTTILIGIYTIVCLYVL